MAEATLMTGQATTEAGTQQTTADPAEKTGEGAASTGETKPEGGQKTDAGKPTGAPEKYEFKAPEGATLDEAHVAEVSALAKELNLTNEQAQKLVDRDLKARADGEAAFLAKGEALAKSWEESAKADKEFGGEQLAANLSVAKKALDAFGTPELKQHLNETGLGSHPEVIRFFLKVGKAISEDGQLVRGGAPGEKKPAEKVLYDKR